jgi:hypothetical protein
MAASSIVRIAPMSEITSRTNSGQQLKVGTCRHSTICSRKKRVEHMDRAAQLVITHGVTAFQTGHLFKIHGVGQPGNVPAFFGHKHVRHNGFPSNRAEFTVFLGYPEAERMLY